MFIFNYEQGGTSLSIWGIWLIIFLVLFGLNELTRRNKYIGFCSFVVLPIILSILWFTVLSDTTYTDWFHLAKVYSSTAGCIGFWCIRHVKWKNKISGVTCRLVDKKWILCFPPLILAINIMEAVVRDLQVGMQYVGGGYLADEAMYVLGGPWNYVNAIAGVLNIITITGWLGICIRKVSTKDKSQDMLWPDMLWFWIIAYDLWNFAYTYNCLPGHAWYCGFALLLAPTVCAFTVGKGAWLQHRAHTLALWCMFAQTFPAFIDQGKYAVASSYNQVPLFAFSLLALVANLLVLIYMINKSIVKKKNPYHSDLYVDLKGYQNVKSLSR